MTWQNSNVGECKRGITVCPEDGGQPFCKGFVSPAVEICDGKDNDCSGSIDELHECCVKKGPEVCNGIDDDCSGTVDDILATEFCYSDRISTANVGPCRPGLKTCIMGKWICKGEVVPRVEVCNEIDDDCSGQIDENLGSTTPIDFIFVVDNSGSMSSKIEDLISALNKFVGNYVNRNDIRWGVVGAPGPKYGLDGQVTLLQNLGDVGVFRSVLEDLYAGSGGYETTIDAAYMLCDPKNPLKINWGTSKRYIVILSDEIPQSYWNPPITAKQASDSCALAGIPIMAFSDPYPDMGWIELTSMPGGRVWPIDSSTISANLQPTIKELACY